MVITLAGGGQLEIIPGEMVCISSKDQEEGDIDQCLLWQNLSPVVQRALLGFVQKTAQEASTILRLHSITY